MITLSIIIINYHSQELIKACLASLQTHHSDLSFEVVVINNGGVLNELETIPIKNLRIISANENIGFSRANNLGAKQVKGKYILFLNPDTVFISESLTSCIERMEMDTEAGLLGCRLLNVDKSLQLSYHDGNKVFTKLWRRNPIAIKFFKGSLKARASMEEIRYNHTKEHNPEWITGAFLLAKRSTIEKHQLHWDEDFFMYWEDVELCLRAKRKGIKAIYFPGAELIHIGGSGEPAALSRFKMMEDSRLMFIRKEYGRVLQKLYVFLLKAELKFELFLEKRKNGKKNRTMAFQNELNYYGISKN